MPAETISPFCLGRMHTWLHTIIEQWIAFQHIHYVELDFSFGWYISDFKIKPLRIAFTIDIILQDQVILIFTNAIHRE